MFNQQHTIFLFFAIFLVYFPSKCFSIIESTKTCEISWNCSFIPNRLLSFVYVRKSSVTKKKYESNIHFVQSISFAALHRRSEFWPHFLFRLSASITFFVLNNSSYMNKTLIFCKSLLSDYSKYNFVETLFDVNNKNTG